MGWFKNLLKNGLKIGWSSGKTFDPQDQERTDAMDDLVRPKKKKKK